MRIILLGAHFTKYFSICVFFAPLYRDVGVVDKFKSARTFDTLVVWSIVTLA